MSDCARGLGIAGKAAPGSGPGVRVDWEAELFDSQVPGSKAFGFVLTGSEIGWIAGSNADSLASAGSYGLYTCSGSAASYSDRRELKWTIQSRALPRTMSQFPETHIRP
jgi:hypothetical protein